MSELIELNQARSLLNQTVEDLKSSLTFVRSVKILHRALELIETEGAGYGSGKTAMKLIQSRIRKLEKLNHEH